VVVGLAISKLSLNKKEIIKIMKNRKILIIRAIIVICLIVGCFLLYEQIYKLSKKELKLSNFPDKFKEKTVIVLGDNASEIERQAAEEMKHFLYYFSDFLYLKYGTSYEMDIKIIDSQEIESFKKGYNLVVIGTPKTNSFLEEVYARTNATRVTEEFPGEGKGIVEILPNPWDESKAMLLVEYNGNETLNITINYLLFITDPVVQNMTFDKLGPFLLKMIEDDLNKSMIIVESKKVSLLICSYTNFSNGTIEYFKTFGEVERVIPPSQNVIPSPYYRITLTTHFGKLEYIRYAIYPDNINKIELLYPEKTGRIPENIDSTLVLRSILAPINEEIVVNVDKKLSEKEINTLKEKYNIADINVGEYLNFTSFKLKNKYIIEVAEVLYPSKLTAGDVKMAVYG